MPAAQYEIVVVDIDGTPYGTVTDGRLGRVSWELNGPGAAAVTLATTDPDAALLQPGREIQIYYQGSLVWWGPIVRPQAGLKESTWQCAGLLWYFTHRFIGRADRVNQILNGDFEAGETNWTFQNGVTHSIDTGTVVEGTNSLELAGTPADHNQYATQTYTHTQWHPAGDVLTASAWVNIPSGDYLGGAIEDRGLMMIRRNADGDVLDVATLGGTIDDDTPKDVWLPLEVAIIGNKEGDTVEVRLYPPHGTAFYDLVTLTLMESLGFDADVADIIAGIVEYAQDLGIFTHGKSDLNISTAGAATGVVESIAYQFAEHRQILDAILEYVRRGIVDIDIAITPTTRVFTTYAPTRGSLYGTTLALDVNLADFTYSWDGENAATSVVILGPGDGPDRPEGGATNTTLFPSGLTLEIVDQAPDDSTVGQLDDRAADRLATAVRPQILEVTTLPGAGIIGTLNVGDTIPVDISHGWVTIADTYRVVRIEADLVRDQATLTLNATP